MMESNAEFRARLTHLSIVSILLVIQCISIVWTNLDTARARRRSELDGKIAPDTRMLWIRYERHGTFCVGECGRDISCVSVFYNKVTSQCQGHSITVSNTEDASDETDSRLYVLPRGERYIGDNCSTNTDCITTDSQCFNGRCICEHGYSLKPTTYQCLPDCITYGEDFMEVKNFFISGMNSEIFTNCSFPECKALCRNRTEYTCRSIEYQWPVEKCFLANITYSHHPDRWYEDDTFQFNLSYFQRDCQE